MRPVLSAALMTALVASGCARGRDPLPGFPRVFVWAWERPENLEPLDPQEAGIAFLARTVRLSQGGLTARPRMSPLSYPRGAVLMAVVRMESDGTGLPPAAAVAQDIARVAELPEVRAVQVDYDAVASERAFYREVLDDLRRRLPAAMPLSMTALVSWCSGDRWLEGLPVAEAVPMFFRMGEPWRGGALGPECRASVGVSTDEPFVRAPRAGRVYIFHPRAWSREELRAVAVEARKWL